MSETDLTYEELTALLKELAPVAGQVIQDALSGTWTDMGEREPFRRAWAKLSLLQIESEGDR